MNVTPDGSAPVSPEPGRGIRSRRHGKRVRSASLERCSASAAKGVAVSARVAVPFPLSIKSDAATRHGVPYPSHFVRLDCQARGYQGRGGLATVACKGQTVEVLGGGSEEWAEGNGELPSMMGRARAQTLSKTWTNIGSILARYTQALVTDEPFAGEISE